MILLRVATPVITKAGTKNSNNLHTPFQKCSKHDQFPSCRCSYDFWKIWNLQCEHAQRGQVVRTSWQGRNSRSQQSLCWTSVAMLGDPRPHNEALHLYPCTRAWILLFCNSQKQFSCQTRTDKSSLSKVTFYRTASVEAMLFFQPIPAKIGYPIVYGLKQTMVPRVPQYFFLLGRGWIKTCKQSRGFMRNIQSDFFLQEPWCGRCCCTGHNVKRSITTQKSLRYSRSWTVHLRKNTCTWSNRSRDCNDRMEPGRPIPSSRKPWHIQASTSSIHNQQSQPKRNNASYGDG